MIPPIAMGTLESVDLRQVWITEAGDFTPWLAKEENVALLSEAIGIELEVEAMEKDVGPFRADILRCLAFYGQSNSLFSKEMEGPSDGPNEAKEDQVSPLLLRGV